MAIAVALVAGATAAAAGDAAPVSATRARELEHMVRHDCGSCHGMTLKGGLGPDIRPSRFAGVPPQAIAQLILDGKPGTAMPPWRPLLSEGEALWIATYLTREPAQ
jgi:cytochrome c55X